MNEGRWLYSGDPALMLRILPDVPGCARKLRLFACDCARHVWRSVEDGMIPEQIALAERLAEGAADIGEIETAQHQLGGRGGYSPEWAAVGALSAVLDLDAWESAERAMRMGQAFRHYIATDAGQDGTIEEENEGMWQAIRLRDIFGNPFRSVALDPRWLTSSVVDLARSIYEGFPQQAGDHGMPILADALIDAGCDDEQVLAHCRSDGPHVRGCWVVDLLLGKS